MKYPLIVAFVAVTAILAGCSTLDTANNPEGLGADSRGFISRGILPDFVRGSRLLSGIWLVGPGH